MVDPNAVDILLVEDNPNDVELTLRALNKKNIANPIHIVGDGAEALDYLFARGKYQDRDIKNRPKIILLDLKLPKVDGKEILKIIKSDNFLKVIPVVVLTSSQEEKDIIMSYQLGVNSYIVKPVDFEKFVDAVTHIGLYWLMVNQPPI